MGMTGKRSCPDEEAARSQKKPCQNGKQPEGEGDNGDGDSLLSDLFANDDWLLDTRTFEALKDLKIQTLADLLSRRDDFKGKLIGALRKPKQEDLYRFCLWYDNFYKQNDKGVSWRPQFTTKSYDDFVDELKESTTPSPAPAKPSNTGGIKPLFDHTVRMIHEGTPGDLADLASDTRDKLYEYVVGLTMKELPPKLVDACNFDVKDLITKCASAIINLPTGEPYPKIQLVAGRTQSGKSNVKAVVQATCDLLRCPLIIITKGVAESKDLAKKVNNLLNQEKDEFEVWWTTATKTNRSIVLPDTAARITKSGIPTVNQLRAIKPHGKFVVIVDECDAMYRTEGGEQKMEKAYSDLMGLGPCLRVEISATPIPALFALTEKGHTVEILELGTSDDYSGLTEMKPLQTDKGKKLYLSAKKEKMLKHDRGVHYSNTGTKKLFLRECDTDLLFPGDPNEKLEDGESRRFSLRSKLDFIPFTDPAVLKLYESALFSGKQGVLLLDCTTSRVDVENNIFEKAACVQNHFLVRNKQVAIVVVVGSGIHVRRPSFLHGRSIRKKTVSEVIEQLDQVLGLEMPLFIFGYSKMRRCISYRSERRVPTHMVLSLGPSQSNESYIQALGRATFNGLETVLNANGFSHVTVHTFKNDLRMAKKYTSFVHEVSERLKTGATIDEVMSDGKERFSDLSNYFRHSNRKTGQIKSHRHLLPDQDMFEDPIADDTDDSVAYSHDDTSRRILRALLDLVHDSRTDEYEKVPGAKDRSDAVGQNTAVNNSMVNSDASHSDADSKEAEKDFEEINRQGFTTKQILEKYNTTYQDGAHTLKKAVLNAELTRLRCEAKVEKVENRWRAKNLRALKQLCLYDC